MQKTLAVSSDDLKEALHLEECITNAAPRFSLGALVDLLISLGYKEDDIEYRSHPTTLHQSAVISSVRFIKDPRRHVVITVNLGWLAPQSPLPIYFQKIFSQQNEPLLEQFLNFFCHQLLRAATASAFPERDQKLFRDWQKSRRELRSLLGLRSLSTIHWVFGLVFPELEVAVERSVLQRQVRTRGMILGDWVIGDGSACGGATQVPVSALTVTLLCDEPVSGLGTPWASEAVARLHAQAFPALSAHGLFLQVVLVLRDQQSFMVLQPRQYLGYEPISDGKKTSEGDHKSARVVVVWSGEVPMSRQR